MPFGSVQNSIKKGSYCFARSLPGQWRMNTRNLSIQAGKFLAWRPTMVTWQLHTAAVFTLMPFDAWCFRQLEVYWRIFKWWVSPVEMPLEDNVIDINLIIIYENDGHHHLIYLMEVCLPQFGAFWGDIITESEILAEYFDMSSQTSTPKLVPSDPVKASHMRLAMKKFNDVIPGLRDLLSLIPYVLFFVCWSDGEILYGLMLLAACAQVVWFASQSRPSKRSGMGGQDQRQHAEISICPRCWRPLLCRRSCVLGWCALWTFSAPLECNLQAAKIRLYHFDPLLISPHEEGFRVKMPKSPVVPCCKSLWRSIWFHLLQLESWTRRRTKEAKVTLAHYRGFQLIQDPRISELLEAVRALPEFQNGNCPDEDIIVTWQKVYWSIGTNNVDQRRQFGHAGIIPMKLIASVVESLCTTLILQCYLHFYLSCHNLSDHACLNIWYCLEIDY